MTVIIISKSAIINSIHHFRNDEDIHTAILLKGFKDTKAHKSSKCLADIKRNPGNVCNTVHAEENICKHLPYNYKNKSTKLDNYNVLVFRYNRNSQLANSRPCRRCIIIMQKYKINNVFYSTDEGNIACEKVRNMDYRTAHITSGSKKFNFLRDKTIRRRC